MCHTVTMLNFQVTFVAEEMQQWLTHMLFRYVSLLIN
jgi:hypothetical protein